jgi:predicted enzyme related to lactoylglutathione lyase
MKLKLIVIKTDKPQELAAFYSTLDIQFHYHQHGNGPFHYAAEDDGIVFEIYPLPKTMSVPDTSTRLGFEVIDLDVTIQNLKKIGAKIITEPSLQDEIYHAIIEDPDGRKVELTQEEVAKGG